MTIRHDGCRFTLTALLIGTAALTGSRWGGASAAEVGPAPVTSPAPMTSPAPAAAPAPLASPEDGDIHAWHVAGNVWLMAGEPGGTNVAVQVGDEGVLVVDTGVQPMADRLVAAIRKLAASKAGDQKDIRWVVNSDGLADHVGGNEVVRRSGSFIGGANFEIDNAGLTPGAFVVANLNVMSHMVAEGVAKELWPTETHIEDLYGWNFNGEAVMLYHPHSANTDGNTQVLFRGSDVLATGDVFDMLHYPVIDVAHGGSIDGELAALNDDIDLAVAGFHNGPQEGGTMIIPGHGRLCDQADLVEYTIIVTTIRNRVMYYKNQGKTLEQVLALKPSWDFDARWGATSGPWTTRQFIEAVYRTLPRKGPSLYTSGVSTGS
jgi:glyoxylase-like metal-dependent hydrolase (beta-lactamase superfamily II)